METRGKNKDFIINAVLMILSKNYNITLEDTHEIDTFISISENIDLLKIKYSYQIPLNEINTL